MWFLPIRKGKPPPGPLLCKEGEASFRVLTRISFRSGNCPLFFAPMIVTFSFVKEGEARVSLFRKGREQNLVPSPYEGEGWGGVLIVEENGRPI